MGAKEAMMLAPDGNSRTSPTYTSWRCMVQRVTNPKHPRFAAYGGRGVTIHADWRSDFQCFLRDVGVRPSGHTLDRIDPFGNYVPGNVRWATPREQRNNQRRNAAQEGA
jgi:hypothetical protein